MRRGWGCGCSVEGKLKDVPGVEVKTEIEKCCRIPKLLLFKWPFLDPPDVLILNISFYISLNQMALLPGRNYCKWNMQFSLQGLCIHPPSHSFPVFLVLRSSLDLANILILHPNLMIRPNVIISISKEFLNKTSSGSFQHQVRSRKISCWARLPSGSRPSVYPSHWCPRRLPEDRGPAQCPETEGWRDGA